MDTAKLRVDAFHKRHGAECYPYGGFYWYADGAYRDEHPLGALVEPPDSKSEKGEYELHERKVTFHRAKLNRVTSDYEDLRETLTYLTPPDQEGALAKLKQMRDAVRRSQAELRKAESALDQTAIAQRRKQRREENLRQQAKIEEFRARLRAIRL